MLDTLLGLDLGIDSRCRGSYKLVSLAMEIPSALTHLLLQQDPRLVSSQSLWQGYQRLEATGSCFVSIRVPALRLGGTANVCRISRFSLALSDRSASALRYVARCRPSWILDLSMRKKC